MKIVKGLLLLFTLCVFGCKDKDSHKANFCNVDSIDDLDWLKEEIESNGYSQPSTGMDILVYQAYYQNKEVFYTDLCCPVCNVAPPRIRNCNGEVLGQIGVEINSNQLTNKTVIWRTNSGVCP